MSDATPAATVVVIRDARGGPELLMTQRHAKLGFAGGAMVFPGGKVDPGDLGIARDAALATGFEGLDDVDAAARVAGAREVLEEVGIVLSVGPPLAEATLTEWRERFAAIGDAGEAATYAAFLAATGHCVDAAALTPFARWVPPEGLHRRFDTWFYVAPVAGVALATPDGAEAVTARWTTAAAALADGAAGGSTIIFPTARNLERLAQYPTVAALLATLRAEPVLIQPAIVERDGERWLTIPEGRDYPVTSERLDSALRG